MMIQQILKLKVQRKKLTAVTDCQLFCFVVSLEKSGSSDHSLSSGQRPVRHGSAHSVRSSALQACGEAVLLNGYTCVSCDRSCGRSRGLLPSCRKAPASAFAGCLHYGTPLRAFGNRPVQTLHGSPHRDCHTGS